jgi:hypothetical protein
MFLEMLRQAGIVALLSMVVPIVPLVLGVAYAVWPTEARLALMRIVAMTGARVGERARVGGVGLAEEVVEQPQQVRGGQALVLL